MKDKGHKFGEVEEVQRRKMRKGRWLEWDCFVHFRKELVEKRVSQQIYSHYIVTNLNIDLKDKKLLVIKIVNIMIAKNFRNQL